MKNKPNEKRKKLSEFAGTLTEKQANEMIARIKEARAKSLNRINCNPTQ